MAALTEVERELLVAEYTLLVETIAKSLIRKLPANVQIEDLLQDGFVGLLEAILHTTLQRVGAQFLGYVSMRVRGAMLDGLRLNDPATRSTRRAMRDVERVIQKLGKH